MIVKPTQTVTVDDDGFDCALVLKVWDENVLPAQEVRVAVKDVPAFMADVVRHASYALRNAAERLEVGHCETCGNTRLVPDTGPAGRPTNKRCPDCGPRRPDEPFAGTPTLGHRAPKPVESDYQCDKIRPHRAHWDENDLSGPSRKWCIGNEIPNGG